MRPQQKSDCPRSTQISALIDDELAGNARDEIASHATACPLCGAMLRDMTELHLALRPLAATQLGVDLAPRVEQRISPRHRPTRASPANRWWHGWQFAPSGLAAAGMLAVGVYIGALLAGGSAVAMQPIAMAAFDSIPPGSLCLGAASCYERGR